MTTQSAKTVVLGLGNLLHADDGAGAQAIKRLREDRRVSAGVSLVEGGTLGLELLSYVWDCEQLIVIDAVDVGRRPGTVVRLSGEELNSLVALRVLVQRRPEVVLIGVQPKDTNWGTELSKPVANAMDTVVEAAVRELQRVAENQPAA
jgi:hydrogenase maturation protease